MCTCWVFLQGGFCSVYYFVLTLHVDYFCASSRYYSSLHISSTFIIDSTNIARRKKKKKKLKIVEECNICQSIIFFF